MGADKQQSGTKQQEFEKLFSEHRDMVYRAAYSVTGNKHEAQDVLQDVFLKLIAQGRTLEFITNRAGYLFRMAVHKATERFRMRNRQKETDDGLEPLRDIAKEGNPRDEGLRESLKKAMSRLQPEDAELLVLSVEQGYTDTEIAAMSGKTRGAVAVALHRMRARLKEFMELGGSFTSPLSSSVVSWGLAV